MSKVVIRPNQNHNNNNGGSGKFQNPRKKKDLRKIYESPKFFLREDTEKLQDIFYEEFVDSIQAYIDWRTGKGGKKPDWLFNMMTDLAFVAILPELIDENVEFIEDNGDLFCGLISNSVGELQRRKLNGGQAMTDIFVKVYENLNGKRIQDIFDLELDNVTWEVASKLAIASHGSPKYTVNNTLRLIYQNLKLHNLDDLEILLKELFGKSELPKVAIYILLERKSAPGKGNWIDRKMFDALTQFALFYIEGLKKSEIKSLFKIFINERRKSEFDFTAYRRVNLSELDKDEFPRIVKVTKKMAKRNELNRIFLDREKKMKRNMYTNNRR